MTPPGFHAAFALVAVLAAGAACGTGESDSLATPADPAAAPAPGADVPPEGVTVPLELVATDAGVVAVVHVTLGSSGPLRFGLDTAATGSVVDRPVADRLGLPTTGERHDVSGPAFAATAGTVFVEAWTLGDMALAPSALHAVDLPEPARDRGLDGLLGADVLSALGRWTVDYGEGVLVVGPGLAPPSSPG